MKSKDILEVRIEVGLQRGKLVLLSTRASFWFSLADKATKRRLVKLLYSNPSIKARKAILAPRKPLVEVSKISKIPVQLRDKDTNRTNDHSNSKLRQKIGDRLKQLACDPETVAFAKEAKTAIEMIDPEALSRPLSRPLSVLPENG